MKSVVAVALASFVAVVSTQSLSDLPSCALPCLVNSLGSTSCSATDFKCACSNPLFISGSNTCIVGACGAADQQTALAVAKALCKSAGVTITVPGSESTSVAASSTSAATSAAAPTSVGTSSSIVSTTKAPAAATSTATTAGGSTESFPSVSESPTRALNTSATVVPSGNVTATSTSPPLQTTNAGNRLSGMSGFVVLGLGLAAAFAI